MSAQGERPEIGHGAVHAMSRVLPLGFCLVVLGCGQQIMTPMAAEALAPPQNLLDEINTTRQSVSSPAPPANLNPSSGSLKGSYRGSSGGR